MTEMGSNMTSHISHRAMEMALVQGGAGGSLQSWC